MIPPGVADPEVDNAVVGVAAVSGVAEPVVAFVADVFAALVFAADIADPVVDVVAVVVAEVVSEVAEPGDVFVAVVSVADIVEPRAAVDIALAFDALVPVSAVAVEVDSSGRPRFFAFPNIYYYSSSSNSVEVVGWESVHSSTGVRASYGLCRIFSSPGLHHNKNSVHCYNKPNPGYNNVSDTSDLPMVATTSHSRKTGLYQYLEQRTHSSYQEELSHPVALEIRWVVAEIFQYLYLPRPLMAQER